MYFVKPLAALLAALFLVGAAPATPPNIVVVIMDTTRVDHLSCYGYERETTPHLEALSADAVRFTNAYATSAWTVPSHASILTGLHGVSHGATQENWHLAPELVTLPEQLRAAGYKTVGICENAMLTAKSGFSQGFDTYYEPRRMKTPVKSVSRTLDLFRETLADKGDAPVFCFVNLIAPHSPYVEHAKFRGTFVKGERLAIRTNMWRRYYIGQAQLSDTQLSYLKDLYDTELLFTDFVIGQMIEALRETGAYDNTVFMVTSDHGENFGEHAHVDHVFNLYEPLVHVPLMVRYPGEAARQEDRPVQISDIFPTALRAAGLPVPAQPASQAVDLFAGPHASDRAIFMEYYWPKQALRGFKPADREHPKLAPYKRLVRAVKVGQYKYIEGTDGRRELYDLEADPGELHDLIGQRDHEERAERMRKLLIQFVESGSQAGAALPRGDGVAIDEAGLDEDVLESLRTLGYLD